MMNGGMNHFLKGENFGKQTISTFFDHQIRQLCNIKRRIFAYDKIHGYFKIDIISYRITRNIMISQLLKRLN